MLAECGMHAVNYKYNGEDALFCMHERVCNECVIKSQYPCIAYEVVRLEKTSVSSQLTCVV